jgi:excisionase family DNA binding protein
MAQRPSRPPPPAAPRWASLAQASEYLGGIPERTIRSWISKGWLPGFRIGPRQLQVNLNDLDAMRTRIPVGASDS